MYANRVRDRVLNAGRLVLALTLICSSAIAQDVNPPIRSALNSGDTATALTLLNQAIQTDPAYNVNYQVLGRIYFDRKQYDQAKEQFLAALSRKSKDFESLYYLGLTYLETGDLANAEKTMTEGEQKAKDEKHQFEDGLGQILMAKKDYQGADKAFRRAIQLKDMPVYHIHLGDANFRAGVPSLAAGEYDKALKSDTGSTEVYYHWAEACLEMKDYQCALEKLRIVLTKDSTHADAWARAGSIYFKAALSTTSREDRANRFKETIGSYKRYFELAKANPDSAHVREYFESAMAYLNLGGFDSAAAGFEKVLAIPYEPRDIYFNYGKALWGLKQYDKAAQQLQKHAEWLAKQSGDNPSSVSPAEYNQLLGDCYFYAKPSDYASAVTAYKKSLETDPNQKRIIQNVALCYHMLKSYAQAIDYYGKRIAMGIDSSTSSIYKNAALCALNLAAPGSGSDEGLDGTGDSANAASGATRDTTGYDPNKNYYQVGAEYLEKYLAYNAGDTKMIALAGRTYLYNLKDCTNGVKQFDQLLKLEPTNCEAKRSMGYAYFSGLCTKNYSKALDYLLAANECQSKGGSGCSDPELLLWIAQAYHLRAVERASDKVASKADFKSANQWYARVLKCDPKNGDAKKGLDATQYEFN